MGHGLGLVVTVEGARTKQLKFEYLISWFFKDQQTLLPQEQVNLQLFLLQLRFSTLIPSTALRSQGPWLPSPRPSPWPFTPRATTSIVSHAETLFLPKGFCGQRFI